MIHTSYTIFCSGVPELAILSIALPFIAVIIIIIGQLVPDTSAKRICLIVGAALLFIELLLFFTMGKRELSHPVGLGFFILTLGLMIFSLWKLNKLR